VTEASLRGRVERSSHVATFEVVQGLLLSVDGVSEFLHEVSELASQIVSPRVSCGITLEYDGHPLTMASSDAKARSLDEWQHEVGEGTCLHAMRAGEVVEVGDADLDTRWPAFMEQARARGVKSSLSLPLIVRDTSMGAINLYSCEQTHAFDAERRGRLEMFAAQASTALMVALRRARQDATNKQLEAALTSRSTIDQAMGILMGQQRCSAQEAFDLLRAHSQVNNIKLREVAEHLVSRTASTPRTPTDGPVSSS
jgi:GAF domain-containing protein